MCVFVLSGMIHCGSGHLLLVLFVHCINSAHNDDWRLTSDWWWLEPVYDLQWPAESSFKGYPYNTGYRDPAEYKTEMPKDLDWISSVSNPGSISTYRQGRRQDLVPAMGTRDEALKTHRPIPNPSPSRGLERHKFPHRSPRPSHGRKRFSAL